MNSSSPPLARLVSVRLVFAFCIYLAFAMAEAPFALAQGAPAEGGSDASSSDASAESPEPSEDADLAGGASSDGTFFEREALNEGLPEPDEPLNLATPQAAIETFADAARAGEWERAVHVLDLSLVPREERATRGPELARKLHYVIEETFGFDWEGLPDRPDGLAETVTSPNDPMVGSARKSLSLGTVTLDGRDRVVRLQRVKVGDAEPVWTISPQSVENIPALYERFGPSWMDQRMPEWALQDFMGNTALWEWLALLSLILVAAGLVWVFRWMLAKLLTQVDDDGWMQDIGELVSTGGSVVGALFFLYVTATSALSLPQLVSSLLLSLTLLAAAWLAMRVIRLLVERAVGTRDTDLEELSDNDREERQRWLTYLSVGRRVILFVLFLVGVGIVVGQFQGLRSLGISMMASAGVVSVVLGFAAQPVLGNIVAGVQIALARPIRIGDSVLYEGEWGYVEDVTYTFVLIRIWDHRRLVVPLRYFVTHPIENWTIRNAHLIKPVHLHVDYTIDVDAVREKFDELVRADDGWDEETEPTVEVVEVGDETITLRLLSSAKDAATAWSLHCRLREQMVAFVRDLEGGRFLPRRRMLWAGEAEDASPRRDDQNRSRRAKVDAEDGTAQPLGPTGPGAGGGADGDGDGDG